MTSIDALHTSLEAELRDVSRRDLRAALEGFDDHLLSLERRRRQLTVTRLRFEGEKSGDFHFHSGVNILRAGNDKGKSSVLKLIHFCLTGKNDLKKDVDAWIRRVELRFELDGHPHGLAVDKGRRPKGVLYRGSFSGQEMPGLAALESANDIDILLRFSSGKDMQQKLEAYFNEALGLRPLMGTQKDSRKGSDELLDAPTSYRAYMRGMYINQDLGYTDLITEGTPYGSLFTKVVGMLLGVHGMEAFFAVEARLAHVENALGKEERYHRRVEKSFGLRDLATLDQEIKKLEGYIDGLKVDKTALFVRSTSGDLGNRLQDLTERLVSLDAAGQQMARRVHGLQLDLQASDEAIADLEAAIQSHQTFAPVQPHRCPVCEIALAARQRHPQPETGRCVMCHEDLPADLDISGSLAIAEQRLQEARQSRSKQARGLEVRRAELEEIEFKSEQLEQQKRHLQTQLRSAHQGTEELEREIELETRYLGRLEAERDNADRMISDDGGTSNLKKLMQRKRILSAALRHLRTLHADINERLKQDFSRRVQEYCTTIGFPGLEGVELDDQLRPLIQQNGKIYRFHELSPGERVRFVLAFYLGMAIATAEDLEYGAHPGMLLIDSPGKEEMVAKDFSAVVDLLSLAERRHADKIQVIVATTIRAIASAAPESKQAFVDNDEDPLF